MGRKLATVRTISNISEIENADAIEALKIDGWTVVAQKNQGYTEGSRVIYFEPDSFLPIDDPRFAFLEGRGVKTNQEGTHGHVLRTIKLRGTYSEGMVLPVDQFPEAADLEVGADIGEAINVTKWEPPLPAQLAGEVYGYFPSWMRKTDAERVQNLRSIFPLEGKWFATEKIDGTSATYALTADGDFVVCSRNMRLKASGNVYWQIAERYDIDEFLRQYQFEGRPIVLQGEIYGEGIQKNPLGIRGIDFRAFGFMIDDPFGYNAFHVLEGHPAGIQTVPRVNLPLPLSPDEALGQVDGMKSLISPERQSEGVVWWSVDGEERNFKALNQKFLARLKD